MKKNLILLFSFLWLCCTVQAENSYTLPHIANGVAGGISMRTTFILFNRGNHTVQAEMTLTTDHGDPLIIKLPGFESSDRFLITLNPGQTQLLQTDGEGALVAGGAHIQTFNIDPLEVAVSAIFSIYVDDRFVTEAGVSDSPASGDFVIPVDAHGAFQTGLAIYNAGNSEITLSLQPYDAAGNPVGSPVPVTMQPHERRARFVANEFIPGLKSLQGTLVVTCQDFMNISALTLRQHDSPLSFTTLPAVRLDTNQYEFNLPQVANGTHPLVGTMKTSFVLFNLASQPAVATISLSRNNGTPFPVTIPGVAEGSGSFQVTLPVHGSAFLQTDGSGDLDVGAARITSTQSIGVSAIFTLYDLQGHFLTEAAVGDSALYDAVALPVDSTGSFKTGVALFNPGSESAEVSIRMLDVSGATLAQAQPITLLPNGHAAQFVTELLTGATNRQGSLAITSDRPVSAVALRQNASPVVYSTLPVVERAFQGAALNGDLLTQQQSGIDASSPVEVNLELPVGWKVTGTVTPPSGGGTRLDSVAATSGSSVYRGFVNPANGQYSIVLPSGQYSLSFGYSRWTSTSPVTRLSYTLPAAVQVSGDTTRNVTLPAVDRFIVSGQVGGLEGLPPHGDVSIQWASSDLRSGAVATVGADGSYSMSLPNGQYTGSLSVTGLQVGEDQLQDLKVYNVGSLTVAGLGVSGANLALPELVTVDGQMSFTGSALHAVDRSVPTPGPLAVLDPFAESVADSGSGSHYTALLVKGRTYALSSRREMELNSLVGMQSRGFADYPVPPLDLTLNEDASQDIFCDELPGTSGLSGRVTRPDGSGVGGATVTATSNQLDGTPGVKYVGQITTDADGYYDFSVLRGSYDLTVEAPIPQP